MGATAPLATLEPHLLKI